MSISLKNHEDRIKVLEDRSTRSIITETLLNSTKSGNNVLTKSMSLFDIIIVSIYLNSTCFGVNCLPYDAFKSTSQNEFEIGGTNSTNRYRYVDDNTIYSRSNGWRVVVIGLKIYYIFRYNIYKILKLISPILKF